MINTTAKLLILSVLFYKIVLVKKCNETKMATKLNIVLNPVENLCVIIKI